MEQRFYKVRLTNGRVVGPIELERIKLFIFKEKITGLEMARLYPTGDWKDINTYPEIADLLMQKLEGKLTVDVNAANAAADESEGGTALSSEGPQLAEGSGITIDQAPAPPVDGTVNTGTPALQLDSTHGSNVSKSAGPKSVTMVAKPEPDSENEKTIVMTADDERTMMVSPEELIQEEKAAADAAESSEEVPIETVGFGEEEVRADPMMANEKTAMLTLKPSSASGEPQKKGFLANLTPKKKKILVALVIVCIGVFVLAPDDDKPTVNEADIPFKVEMPSTASSPDPQKSEKIFKEGLKFYHEDTVEGYKRASNKFLKAAALDANNVRALCMLASSYMNLIDVVSRDENYFNVITRLIELERAKGLDFGETVIADVELYQMLGNPDAAFNRIVEYSKSHPQWGMEMLYYLALSFYMKGQYPDALAQLNKIDFAAYTSPRVPYLFGLIFFKNNQLDEALKAFNATILKSPKHIKARVKLAELYFTKDNLPESGKHADYVIHHPSLASHSELGKAFYFRARMHMVAQRDVEAMQDLELALKNSPDDQDVLLDYYTLKARMGEKVKDAPGKAKMFQFLALGEKSLKENKLDEALANFLSAREAQYNDPTPLLRMAEVFSRKGDLQASKVNLGKAVKLAPRKPELYPKYIRTLIEAYEIEEAAHTLNLYKELSPSAAIVDRLEGELYFKQEKYKEAQVYFKRALGSSNVDASVYVAYANLMFKTNNFRDAAFYYGLAQRFDPFNVEATVGIGKSFAEMESLEKGVEYVQGALQLSPNKAALLNGIGEIYVRKGDYDSALKFAENALTVDPTFALAHKTRGDAYAAKEKKKEAADAYLTYTNLAPLDPSGHVERYKLFLRKNEKGEIDLKSAKESIQKVIDNFPKYPGAYYMLGDLYYQAQNFDAALQSAEVEIKNNPGYVPAYVLAGSCYNMTKDYPKALEVLNKALKMAPSYVPGLLQAGLANHGLKSYAAAQSMLERALQLDSGNPKVHKALCSIYYDLGKRENAIRECKTYLEVYPDAPDKAEVEKWLQ